MSIELKKSDVINNISGSVRLKLIDKKTGEVIEDRESHNMVLKVGKAMLVKLIAGTASYKITMMSIGKGGTADLANNAFNPIPPVASDTGCKNSVKRVNITSKTVDTSATNPKVTFVALFDCSVVNSLVNECTLVFNDNATALSRYTFSTVDLRSSTGFALQVSWTLEFK